MMKQTHMPTEKRNAVTWVILLHITRSKVSYWSYMQIMWKYTYNYSIKGLVAKDIDELYPPKNIYNVFYLNNSRIWKYDLCIELE